MSSKSPESRFDEVGELATLLKNLPGMVYRCANHPDWPMDFVSDECEFLTGYSRSDIEQKRVMWGDLMHPDDREWVWRATQTALEADQAYEFEYRIMTRSGAWRWVWERGRKSARAESHEIRLDGFISDVTGRKQAELDLAEARAFSEAVLETAAEAVITIDVHGHIETFNGAAQRMFDYSLQEVGGKNINLLMPEPYRTEHNGYIQRYLDTNVPAIIGIGREVLGRRKDGTVFPVHLSVSEVQLDLQRKFVGLVRDVSQQRNAERVAREHLEQLAHVDRLNMLGEMASGIAHEINQPLTAISLFSQAGIRLLEAEKIEKISDIFAKLSVHAQRAGDIIERMQTMAHRGENARETVDCNEILIEVVRLAEAEARIRDIVIKAETADGLPLVEVDRVQIQQVALNLLRNGMEAMRSIDCAGGNEIVLTTALCADGDVEISVVDSGCGVSDEAVDNLFTPFSTTKRSGMGMGLPLSRTIVISHGGELRFRNNDGGGATFMFTLPAAPADE